MLSENEFARYQTHQLEYEINRRKKAIANNELERLKKEMIALKRKVEEQEKKVKGL